MESWRKLWRDAVVPLLSDNALKVLREALVTDDPRLIQGATTIPPPLHCVQDWDAEGACLVGFGGWQGEELCTVGEVGKYVAQMCYDIDAAVGEAAACRWLLNWFDETPRPDVIRQLIPEVELAISQREVMEGTLRMPLRLPC